MNTRLLQLVLAVTVMLATVDVFATLTGARATPRQVTISAGRNNVVSITWRVSATTDHRSGVSSPPGTILDPATREPLSTAATTFDAGGAGPFVFRETLILDAATVRSWESRGLRQVILVRSFGDAIGNAVTGTVVLRLSASQLQAPRDAAPAELRITSLRLEFESGNSAALAEPDASLQATLTVQYTGTGVLRGRWQIAEPDSPGAAPLFRTLAIVNTNLVASQRSILRSPVLPTNRSGRYLLRFCVTTGSSTGTGDTLCPDPVLTTSASYHVQGSSATRIGEVKGLSPSRQAVDGSTVFSWEPLPGARVYRLQVFEQPGSMFVTGIVISAGGHETTLSELMQNTLRPGRQYLWRVSAQDDSGREIGASAMASFVYAPDE